MDKQKDRIREIDYFRVFACFSVIVIHVSAIGVVSFNQTSSYYKFIIFINRFFSFAVPAFIFLSGMTNSYNKIGKVNYFKFIKRKVSRILIPYLVWNIIYYTVLLICYDWQINIVFFLRKFITGDMYYHLYFVVIIVQLYLLTPVFDYIFSKYNKNNILIIAAIITILSSIKLKFIYSDRIFLKYLIYYVLGIYAAKEYNTFVKKVKKYKVFSFITYIILTIIYAILFHYKNYTVIDYICVPFSIVSIIFYYSVCMNLNMCKNKIYNVITKISKSSYYIYLMHPLILSISKSLALKLRIQSTTLQLIFCFIVVTISSSIASIVYTNSKEKIINASKKLKSA